MNINFCEVDLDAPTPEELARLSRKVLKIDKLPGKVSEIEQGFAPRPVRIEVLTLTGQRIPIDVRGIDTVRSLRDRFANRRNFDGAGPDSLAITRLLAPQFVDADFATANSETSWMSDERTLESYGVVAGCCVRLHRWAPPVSYLPAPAVLARCVDLDLQRKAIGDNGAKELADALKDQSRSPALRIVRLGLNQITEVGAQSIAAAIQFCRLQSDVRAALHTLDLRYNAIGDAGAAAVAEGCVRGNQALTHLDLTRCEIGNAGARAIGLALLGVAENKKENMSRTQSALPAVDLSASSNLQSRSALRTLLLGQNTIGDAGALPLAAAVNVILPKPLVLASSTLHDYDSDDSTPPARLQTIDLHSNRISDVVALEFARALEQSNCSLKDLNLSDNRITDSSTTALARALGSPLLDGPAMHVTSQRHGGNTSLTSLGLGSLITDQGALELAAALRSNHSLTNLRLVGNRIGDAGALSFAELLTPTPDRIPAKVPVSRNLSGTFVLTPTEQAAAAAQYQKHVREATIANRRARDAAACGGNESLTGLNLNDNRFSAATVKRFAQTLEGNVTLIGLGIDASNPSSSSLSLSASFAAPISLSASLGGNASNRTFFNSTGPLSPQSKPSGAFGGTLSGSDSSAAEAIARVLENNTTLTWYRGPGGFRG